MPVVIQITDTHLFADPQATIAGVETHQSLQAVLNEIREQEPRIDLVIATGDLAHDESPDTYRRLADRLGDLGAPVLYLPGNHDNPISLAHTLLTSPCGDVFEARLQGWRFLLLDTSVSECVGGRLSDTTLESVRVSLERGPPLPTLIAMHHHPTPVGSLWMDNIGLENGQDLLRLLQGTPAVKGIIFGHTHQLFEQILGGIRIMGTPSTCFQFKPNSETLIYDNLGPAYRRLELSQDGTINTRVQYLENSPRQ